MKARKKIKDEIIKRSEIKLMETSTKVEIIKRMPVLMVSLFSYMTYIMISFQRGETFAELVILILSWSAIGFFSNLRFIQTGLALSKTKDMEEKSLKLLKRIHSMNITNILLLNIYVPTFLILMSMCTLNIKTYIFVIAIAVLYKLYTVYVITKEERKDNIPFVLYEATFYEKTKTLNAYIKERNNYTHSTNDEYVQKITLISKVELLNETISEYKDSDMHTRVKIKMSIDAMINDVIAQIKKSIELEKDTIEAFKRKSDKIKKEG